MSILSRLILDPDYMGKEGETSVIKKKCRTCFRWLGKSDILFGSCPYCLEARAANASEFMRGFDSSKQEFSRCFECSVEINIVGLKTWDTVAKSWCLLCTKCGEKQLEKDSQYTNTPWGYDNKLK